MKRFVSIRFRLLLFFVICSLSEVGFSTNAHSQDSAPDVLLQFKTTPESFQWLLDQTRIIFKNLNLSDGFTGSVTNGFDQTFPIVLPKLFGVNLKQAFLRVRIPTLSYQIHQLHVTPTAVSGNDPVLTMTTLVQLQGLDLSLDDGIQVELLVPESPVPRAPVHALLKGKIPSLCITVPEDDSPPPVPVTFEVNRGSQLNFRYVSSDLVPVANFIQNHYVRFALQENETGQDFKLEDTQVLPLHLTLGTQSRTLTLHDFDPVLKEVSPSILQAVFDAISQKLPVTLGPTLLTQVFKNSAPTDFTFGNDQLSSHLVISNIQADSAQELSIALNGVVCPLSVLNQAPQSSLDQCESLFPAPPIAPLLHPSTLAEVRAQTRNLLTPSASQDQAPDAVLSISENYLNRWIHSSIIAGLWRETLDANHLEFGEKEAFFDFSQNTPHPVLILDLHYLGDGTFPTKVLVNAKHPLEFPLRLETELSLPLAENVTVLTLKTVKIASSLTEIRNGLAQYQIPSHLIPLLQRTVAKMIVKMGESFNGKTALEIPLPILKDVAFADPQFQVSELGSIQLLLKRITETHIP